MQCISLGVLKTLSKLLGTTRWKQKPQCPEKCLQKPKCIYQYILWSQHPHSVSGISWHSCISVVERAKKIVLITFQSCFVCSYYFPDQLPPLGCLLDLVIGQDSGCPSPHTKGPWPTTSSGSGKGRRNYSCGRRIPGQNADKVPQRPRHQLI